MHMNQVRARARKLNIDPGLLTKKELIRLIQETEGNFPCFKTDLPACDQTACCWRDDCKPGQAIGMT